VAVVMPSLLGTGPILHVTSKMLLCYSGNIFVRLYSDFTRKNRSCRLLLTSNALAELRSGTSWKINAMVADDALM